MSEKFTFATKKEFAYCVTQAQQDRWYGPRPYRHLVINDTTPWGLNNTDLQAEIQMPAGIVVQPVHICKQNSGNYWNSVWNHHTSQYKSTKRNEKELQSEPFLLHLLADDIDRFRQGSINKRDLAVENRNIKLADDCQKIMASAKDPYFVGELISGHSLGYGHQGRWHNNSANFCVTVTFRDTECLLAMPLWIGEVLLGLEITDDLKLRLNNGEEAPMENAKELIANLTFHRSHNYKTVNGFDFSFDGLAALNSKLGLCHRNLGKLLKGLIKTKVAIPDLELSGIKKTYTRLLPVAEQLLESDPLAYCAFRTFAVYSNRSIEGVKCSSIFNDAFSKVETQEQLLKVVDQFFGDRKTFSSYDFEEVVKNLDVYKEKRKAVIKSQAGRAINKILEEADSLTIDKKKHKLTWAKIESGELPLGAFFRKSEQYFLLNDNWDLWEEMFKRGYGQQAIELANEVKGRTTYEKDLMSYFYFVLYALPKFLKKHTGSKWTCIPKLVNSQNELEPPKADDETGVTRTRSALTPVADNEKKEVVVPYASLAIYGGFGTTYCYSHDYHVLSEGFSFNGYAVTEEIEKKLNGRDDYGLMFYTLTGSAQGRGYPTFLIIFERRERFEDTRVHFHRTHPSRSKSGDYNPIHNWVRVCYNWMAGNINRERIKAQQGDLFFVSVKTDAKDETMEGPVVKDLDFSFQVNQYDKHCFERSVAFAEYTKAAKANVLGYVKLDSETWLKHTEHDDVLIPAGTYAIYQCRSWEANPKGVWSLRID